MKKGQEVHNYLKYFGNFEEGVSSKLKLQLLAQTISYLKLPEDTPFNKKVCISVSVNDIKIYFRLYKTKKLNGQPLFHSTLLKIKIGTLERIYSK